MTVDSLYHCDNKNKYYYYQGHVVGHVAAAKVEGHLLHLSLSRYNVQQLVSVCISLSLTLTRDPSQIDFLPCPPYTLSVVTE